MKRAIKYRRGYSLLEVTAAFTLLSLTFAGMVPLVITQSKYVNRLDNTIRSDAIYHLVPAGSAWGQRLSIPATLSLDEPRTTTYPSTGYINFQVTGGPTGSFQGNTYLADIGLPYGPRGSGYMFGWSLDNTGATKNCNNIKSADERYDTLTHMQKYGNVYWEAAVPNGLYQVRIVCGDPAAWDSIFVITVEDLPILTGIPTLTKSWIEATGLALVIDGRLTVKNGVGALNNKICFIDYAMISPPNVVNLASITHSLSKDEVRATVDLRRK